MISDIIAFLYMAYSADSWAGAGLHRIKIYLYTTPNKYKMEIMQHRFSVSIPTTQHKYNGFFMSMLIISFSCNKAPNQTHLLCIGKSSEGKMFLWEGPTLQP
jgi:hypothetical protein